MDASTALPNEIWNQIFSYCSKKDLKALRLTGEKHLQTLASAELFTTAYVAARGGVLNIFIKLTTHPVLRHHVKEVLYDTSFFVTPAGIVLTDGGDRHTDDEDTRVNTLFREQEHIQTKELFHCFKTALADLSHLRRVVIANLSRTVSLLGDKVGLDGGPLIKRLSAGTQSNEPGLC